MHFFCDFAIFNPESILDSILDPPGLPWGSLLAPKMAETCLEIRLGPPKSGSRLLFRLQEAKKKVPKHETTFDYFEVPKGRGPAAARAPSAGMFFSTSSKF